MMSALSAFSAARRRVARTCKFVEQGKDFTEQMIRYRIVCGVTKKKLREKLLSKGGITLEKCIKICEETTTAALQARYMTTPEQVSIKSEQVFATARSKRWDQSFCYGACHCHYGVRQCPAFGKRGCNNCGKMSHFSMKCRKPHGHGGTKPGTLSISCLSPQFQYFGFLSFRTLPTSAISNF